MLLPVVGGSERGTQNSRLGTKETECWTEEEGEEGRERNGQFGKRPKYVAVSEQSSRGVVSTIAALSQGRLVRPTVGRRGTVFILLDQPESRSFMVFVDPLPMMIPISSLCEPK